MVAALALSVASPAAAIMNGQLDGNRHANVGALVAEFDGQKDWLCSGTLISPTVFLTAAHCTSDLESRGMSRVWVTFEPEFSPTATLHEGTMRTNPAYPGPSSDSADIAVVVLNSPLSGVTPAKLPSAGLFDRLAAQNGLKGQKFTAVGYGTYERQVGGGQPVFEADGVRRYALSSFSALNKRWLRLSQNGATGDGGTCYGDSGGPNFLGTSQTVASITITGDSVCRATNTTYRLDTPQARNFLGRYVRLP
jgi:V8-like Glu-specific endopeptidase